MTRLLGPLRILVVDDDSASLETLFFFNDTATTEIYTASRCVEAVEVVRRLRYERTRLHLSILDYHMPDQTGIDTYEQLTVELPDLQAIFVTGESSSVVEQRVFGVGGRALLPKPVDVGLMRTVLQDVRQDFQDFEERI